MICIIPARGGSKRIPGKNIKDFLGKPLIAYSIEAALNSKVFSEVIVSTDDEMIANVAREFGAIVPFFRDANLSDDYATSTDVIKDAIRRVKSSFSDVCCLYATAPLITAEILKEAAGEFKRQECKFLFSATAFDFPIQRAIKLDENARVSMFYPQFEKTRSQDLEPAFHDAGAFYFGKKEAWLECSALFTPHSKAYLLPRNLVCDIDTLEDFEFAKKLYLINNGKI
ncbi:pseudaminic acid cytidylyltransferase [Campylobacter concisus]|uniref:Pseudaminic acid cytidylyltransferase n=2 Tax=Campylobacter concisus TaxID=199 RepID=A0A1Y5NLC3_9BACT|nr:pseudaminic acid cytidylyltransferase [Campylobacter concisus]ERJ25168.1 Pseudaminic acid cytidylyltransferase [Campylobacter concisus ATCC 51562]OUT18662.1 pseudaminic acid cytidylyltransferase [Campylobacter concisus]